MPYFKWLSPEGLIITLFFLLKRFSNAKAPYLPWRVSPSSDPGMDPTAMRRDVADYILIRARTQSELRNNANKSGMTTSNRCPIVFFPPTNRIFSDIRPVLIHEAELARRGWISNPTLAQIYTTESISQEQHDEQSIAWQTGRGAPVKRHRVRLDYGGETTVVDDE